MGRFATRAGLATVRNVPVPTRCDARRPDGSPRPREALPDGLCAA
jgi:hypothetical protein